MMKERVALLDTDFVSKTFRSCVEDKRLIECALSLPRYKFFCHQQILIELGRHFPETIVWLREKIEDGVVTCYTDEDLLNELQKTYGDGCFLFYMNYLSNACNAYSKDYYSTCYKDLGTLSLDQVDRKEFLNAIAKGDQVVGQKNDLGEIKTAVLLQVLSNLSGEQIFIFCSDDEGARKGITQFENVSCLSVLSLFWWIKKECNFPKEKAKGYFDAYIATLAKSQTAFKVMQRGRVARIDRVPFDKVFDDIYNVRFLLLGTGMLKYVE